MKSLAQKVEGTRIKSLPGGIEPAADPSIKVVETQLLFIESNCVLDKLTNPPSERLSFSEVGGRFEP